MATYTRIPTKVRLSCPSSLNVGQVGAAAVAVVLDQRGYTIRGRRISWRNAGYQAYFSFDPPEVLIDAFHEMPLVGGATVGPARLIAVDSDSGIHESAAIAIVAAAPAPTPTPGQVATAMSLTAPSTIDVGTVGQATAKLLDQNGLGMAGTFDWVALTPAVLGLGLETIAAPLHFMPTQAKVAGSSVLRVTDRASGKTAEVTIVAHSVGTVVAPIRAEWFNVADSAALRLMGANPPAPGFAANSRVIPSLPLGYAGSPSVGTLPERSAAQLTLDATTWPPGSPSRKSARIHYPNRADPAFIPAGGINTPDTPGLCHDYTITPGDVLYGQSLREAWVEVPAKLGAGFLVEVPLGNYEDTPPGSKCTVSGAGHKFIFPGQTQTPNHGRFASYLHPGGGYRLGWPSQESGQGSGSFMGSNSVIPAPGFNWTQFFGRWLGYQYRIRNSRTASLPAAAYISETGLCQGGSSQTTVKLKAGGGLGIVTYGQGGYNGATRLLLKYANGRLYQAIVASITGAGGGSPSVTLTKPTTIPLASASPEPGPGVPDGTTTYYLASKPLVGDGAFRTRVVDLDNGRAVVCPAFGYSNIITAVDGNGGAYVPSVQVCHSVALGRNLNQGPAHDGMEKWYGGAIIYDREPGWGL